VRLTMKEGRKEESTGKARGSGHPVVGVGGVVIRDGRVLLIRRSKKPLKGQWSIPGGHLEWGETIAQAVARELREETGLAVRVGELLEVVERIDSLEDGGGGGAAPPGSSPPFHYILLDYLCEAATGAAQAGGDAAEISWATEDELTQYQLTEAALRVIRRAFALARSRV